MAKAFLQHKPIKNNLAPSFSHRLLLQNNQQAFEIKKFKQTAEKERKDRESYTCILLYLKCNVPGL